FSAALRGKGRTAEKATCPYFPQTQCLTRELSLAGVSVDLDATHVHVAAGAVPAAGHQVGETDLVDLREIRVLDPVAYRDDAIDVELEPAHVGNRDVVLGEVAGGPGGVVAHEPRAVRELEYRANLMEARRAHDPADLRERVREVDEAVTVAQRGGA